MKVDLTVTPDHHHGFRVTGTVGEEQSPINPAESLAAWLGSIDAKELERAALEEDQMTADFTAAVLAVLARWVRGDA